MSTQNVVVKNTGTCALQFTWSKSAPVDKLQESRMTNKFNLSSESKGILLPNASKTFHFSFLPDIEGVCFHS
jgi:hypothetical protein